VRVFVLIREFPDGPSDAIGAYATLEGAQEAAATSAGHSLAWEAEWSERWRARAGLSDYAIYRFPLKARWERRQGMGANPDSRLRRGG
jgi:hypothetical protein